MTEQAGPEPDHPEVRAFWDLARFHAKLNAVPSYFGPTTLEVLPPPAWSYGDDAAEGDAFVTGVLADGHAETSAPRAAYGEEEPPQAGALSILCDGSGQPRALLETTDVDVGDDVVVERHRVIYAP